MLDLHEEALMAGKACLLAECVRMWRYKAGRCWTVLPYVSNMTEG